MSTYLLAFVVGEYDYVEAKDEDGVLHRVYTPKGKAEQGKFALDVSIKTLPFYNKYFKIAYPLPKIDLIAIADFAAGEKLFRFLKLVKLFVIVAQVKHGFQSCLWRPPVIARFGKISFKFCSM